MLRDRVEHVSALPVRQYAIQKGRDTYVYLLCIACYLVHPRHIAMITPSVPFSHQNTLLMHSPSLHACAL